MYNVEKPSVLKEDHHQELATSRESRKHTVEMFMRKQTKKVAITMFMESEPTSITWYDHWVAIMKNTPRNFAPNGKAPVIMLFKRGDSMHEHSSSSFGRFFLSGRRVHIGGSLLPMQWQIPVTGDIQTSLLATEFNIAMKGVKYLYDS